MKSPIALLTGTVLAVALTGCGQTGPLYMPKPPAKPAPVSAVQTPPPPPASAQ